MVRAEFILTMACDFAGEACCAGVGGRRSIGQVVGDDRPDALARARELGWTFFEGERRCVCPAHRGMLGAEGAR